MKYSIAVAYALFTVLSFGAVSAEKSGVGVACIWDYQCQDGLRCNGGRTQKFCSYAKETEECSGTITCDTGLVCTTESGQSTCKKPSSSQRAQENSVCSDTITCDTGLVCTTESGQSTCKKPSSSQRAQENSVCSDTITCDTGLKCNRSFNQWICIKSSTSATTSSVSSTTLTYPTASSTSSTSTAPSYPTQSVSPTTLPPNSACTPGDYMSKCQEPYYCCPNAKRCVLPSGSGSGTRSGSDAGGANGSSATDPSTPPSRSGNGSNDSSSATETTKATSLSPGDAMSTCQKPSYYCPNAKRCVLPSGSGSGTGSGSGATDPSTPPKKSCNGSNRSQYSSDPVDPATDVLPKNDPSSAGSNYGGGYPTYPVDESTKADNTDVMSNDTPRTPYVPDPTPPKRKCHRHRSLPTTNPGAATPETPSEPTANRVNFQVSASDHRQGPDFAVTIFTTAAFVAVLNLVFV